MNAEESKRLLEMLAELVRKSGSRRRSANPRVEVVVLNLHLNGAAGGLLGELVESEVRRALDGRTDGPKQTLDGTDAPPARASELRAMFREVVREMARGAEKATNRRNGEE